MLLQHVVGILPESIALWPPSIPLVSRALANARPGRVQARRKAARSQAVNFVSGRPTCDPYMGLAASGTPPPGHRLRDTASGFDLQTPHAQRARQVADRGWSRDRPGW